MIKIDARKKFLEELSIYGNVTAAAKAAGLPRSSLYALYNKDEVFAAEWAKATKMGAEALEDEGRRRAYEGWDEPVFHKGEECGAVRKYSDTLLIFLLKGLMPEKYRENVNMNVAGGLDISILEKARERAKENI